MRFHLMIAVLCFGLFLRAEETDESVELSWYTNEKSAKEEAAQSQKPIFLYFTADWCGYCHKMEDNTIKVPQVSEYLKKNFVLFKVDYDNHKDLVARYRIRGVPACIVGDPQLQNIAQTSGYLEVDPFLSWLKEAEAKVSPEAIAAAEKAAQIYIDETRSNFREGLTADQYASIRQFFEECRERDPMAMDFAKHHLEEEVKHHPERFSRFLKDEKLHIRILVANTFTKIYGPTFLFDPWEQTQENEANLEVFLKKNKISSLLEDLIDF